MYSNTCAHIVAGVLHDVVGLLANDTRNQYLFNRITMASLKLFDYEPRYTDMTVPTLYYKLMYDFNDGMEKIVATSLSHHTRPVDVACLCLASGKVTVIR